MVFKKMIKFNGLNYKKGSGSYLLFGQYFNGDGKGKGIRSQYLFYSSTGNGFGDGDGFARGSGNGWGDGTDFARGSGNGGGVLYCPQFLKEEFLK